MPHFHFAVMALVLLFTPILILSGIVAGSPAATTIPVNVTTPGNDSTTDLPSGPFFGIPEDYIQKVLRFYTEHPDADDQGQDFAKFDKRGSTKIGTPATTTEGHHLSKRDQAEVLQTRHCLAGQQIMMAHCNPKVSLQHYTVHCVQGDSNWEGNLYGDHMEDGSCTADEVCVDVPFQFVYVYQWEYPFPHHKPNYERTLTMVKCVPAALRTTVPANDNSAIKDSTSTSVQYGHKRVQGLRNNAPQDATFQLLDVSGSVSVASFFLSDHPLEKTPDLKLNDRYSVKASVHGATCNRRGYREKVCETRMASKLDSSSCIPDKFHWLPKFTHIDCEFALASVQAVIFFYVVVPKSSL
ncbi:hypothetical protein BCR37DRAFT_384199 [Protomyces lactucae-debilis]|uniref:Uncharacterized protein n=1 Tax=Protomyces lactucae-debilis TaxID=2754530 RepID=A0A1Y2EU88_PROLT|nr:uncharacterized protein BCR37DRAFT_384199 [Protomyces lactucae-debilis]ORY75130.1 hypothetical protein BCR37DRAFT_384199 [Protomyces lactucae-debilis]